MNTTPTRTDYLRRRQNTWLTAAAVLSSFALVSSSGAATIYQSSTIPSGQILASQLTDLGPGTQDNGRNFTDNGGPPGQTFKVERGAVMGSVTVLGRGDSAGSWNNGAQPMTGSEVWGIQIGSLNQDGSIFVLDTETATGFAAPANISDYLTFKLDNPVALSYGATYVFSISINQGSWFGLAHSDSDVYADGTAINNNSSTANPGSNNGGNRYTFDGNGFAAPLDYDYVFAIQTVPEPTALAFLGLGGLAFLVSRRRRA